MEVFEAQKAVNSDSGRKHCVYCMSFDCNLWRGTGKIAASSE